VTIEADSINATIIGADAQPGTGMFDLAVREIVKALSVKAGQLCTNIRRVFFPALLLDQIKEAVVEGLAALPVGDPADGSVKIGPLVNVEQRDAAFVKMEQLKRETFVVTGGNIPKAVVGADPSAGGFLAPTVLVCADPSTARAVHEIEVF